MEKELLFKKERVDREPIVDILTGNLIKYGFPVFLFSL